MAKDLRHWMLSAVRLAETAAAADEVPVGAVIIDEANDRLIAAAENRMRRNGDSLAHAEMLAMQTAIAKLRQPYLQDLSLFVSLEPCAMCAAAISHARIGKLVFGAYDEKSGGVEHGARVFSHATTHHKPQIIGGVMEERCQKLLQDFFADLRKKQDSA